jgi:DNA-directed RNA polymerase specialized sigma24 family protein
MRESDWREQFERLYPRLYRALVASGASPADAGDALQDAFERALRQEQPIDRLDAWLFVVALRRWRSSLWRRRIFLPLEVLRAHPSVPPPGEDAVLLISELQRLPRREREVIVCRYVLGLSQQETANAIGIAVGTVAATTAHATKKLRERIDATNERLGSNASPVR